MITGIDQVFTTSDNSALIAMLNDSIISSHIADYQVCLRVAEQEAARYRECQNERMERFMNDNVAFYRARIAAWEQMLERGGE